MKFSISSAGLFSHLQAISRVIGSKNAQLPILDNFLFKIDEKVLTVTASDLDTTLITQIELEQVEGNGSVALSAKYLLEILKEFSDQPLEFVINDENLSVTIKSQNGSYNFIGTPGDEFPKVPKLKDNAKSIMYSASHLGSGLTKALFATGNDDLRPVMSGVYFDITPDSSVFVGSDGHKLVRVKNLATKGSQTLNEDGSYEPAAFILPKKPANLLKNILAKESEAVHVSFDDRNVCFKLSNYEMVCRQIEGNYPKYNSVIPVNSPNQPYNPFKAVVDRVSMLNVIKRVSVFASQASQLVKLDFADNELKISAQDIDFSISAQESLSCMYQDEPMSIGFKALFLMEILSNIDSNEVVIELTAPYSAALVLPLEPNEMEDILMLITPIMLD